MFKNPQVTGFFIALAMALFSLIFYWIFIDQKQYVIIDNPTEKTCKITLNDNEIILAPKQSSEVTIKKNNVITAFLNDSLLFKQKKFTAENTKRALINPTLSDYYTYRNYYGYAKNKDSLLKAQHIYIDSTLYFGEIKKYNTLYINDFYLNIDQNYPKIKKSQDTLQGIVKIFRKSQFIEYYNQNLK